MVQIEEKTARQTFYAKCHTSGEGKVSVLTGQALGATVTVVSMAVQRILESLLDGMEDELDEGKRLVWVDLYVPCQTRDVKRAQKNASQKRREAPLDKGPKEKARLQYKNSYHLEEILDRGGRPYLRFRIAEAFYWTPTAGKSKGKIMRGLSMIDSKKGFQQLVQSWLRPPLDEVPADLRAGVCQQAAQQFLSHLGLIESGVQASVAFPSCQERSHEKKEETRLAALAKIKQRLLPFEYKLAREISPGKFEPEDKRGDRSVNVDPDWLTFIRSPQPPTLPLNFVKSDQVIVYRRTWIETKKVKEVSRLKEVPGSQYRVKIKEKNIPKVRLYAALPLFKGVRPDSTLGELASRPELFWWRRHLGEFEPLPAWPGKSLKIKSPALLVPLEYDPPGTRPSRFESALSGQDGRRVNWSLLVERRFRNSSNCWEKEWYLHFATSREVKVEKRLRVLGIHFGIEPILWWVLAGKDGNAVKEGNFGGNTILDSALEAKLSLEESQRGLRWVGDKKFARELNRRTYEIAREIVKLATELDASIALEKIVWVDKRSGGPEANRRYSLWNYGKLTIAIESVGLNWPKPVAIVASVGDYILRYTCPDCGAMRKAGQIREEADTWRENGKLFCRKCSFVGEVSDEHQAKLVARLGASRI